MQKFYYITGAMILVLGGLGIYSSQAGNKMMQNASEGYLLEETVYTASPQENKEMCQKAKGDNVSSQGVEGGFKPLPEDEGVEVAPVRPEPELEETPLEDVTIEESVMESSQ